MAAIAGHRLTLDPMGRNIPAKFGSNRPSGFGEEAWNVKSLQTTDDRLQTTDNRRRTPSDGNSSHGHADIIYDTAIVTSLLFRKSFNCKYNPRMDYVFCLLTLKSSEKWWSPLFGATCNFNDQILIEYPTGTKNSNFVEDHPRNIPAKFGSNRPSGFGKEAWNSEPLGPKFYIGLRMQWKIIKTQYTAFSRTGNVISSPGPKVQVNYCGPSKEHSC
jgi:hypothetical protein